MCDLIFLTTFVWKISNSNNNSATYHSRYSDWLRAGRSGFESRWERDFPPVQTGPGAHPASCKMCTGSFPGVKCGRGVLLTTHPLLVPRSWKSRAIPLPTLWATPGLQRDNFTFLSQMYLRLHVQYILFLWRFIQTWIFSTDFREVLSGRPAVPSGLANRHNEANSRCSKFCERP
jgi:hypothetical protein